jgi:hypothetical protein
MIHIWGIMLDDSTYRYLMHHVRYQLHQYEIELSNGDCYYFFINPN